MRCKVHIYALSEQEQPPRPIAAVVLSDRREQACWLPQRVADEARFFLAGVEAESEEVQQEICSVLQRPSVMVLKSSTHITGAVRTRGVYRAEEPHGTPTYWRAAIGRLKSETGLIYDLQDYGQMLQQMEDYNLQNTEPTPHYAEATVPIRKEHLSAALSRLASVRQDLRERLWAWREQLERGAVHAEAAVRAVLTAGRGGTVEVLPQMSHPSLQFRSAGAGMSGGPLLARGERGETVSEGQSASAVIIMTDAVPGARVAIEEDTVVVTFLDWQASSSPLVVLVPEDERDAPQTPDCLEGEGGAWTARFERVPAGAHLLAIAPVDAS